MKKLPGLTIIMVLCSSFLFAEVYSGAAYTIDFKNWLLSKHPDTTITMALAPKNSTGTYHENIMIGSIPNPYKKLASWEAMKKKQVKGLKKGILGFKLLIRESAKLGGLDALKIEYSGKIGGYSLQWFQYYALKNGKLYIVSYSGDRSDYNRYRDEAIKIMEGFAFK